GRWQDRVRYGVDTLACSPDVGPCSRSSLGARPSFVSLSGNRRFAVTSMSQAVPDGWISAQQLREALREHGGATDGQLEDWRGHGLLPRGVQVATLSASGQVAGSSVWYPPVAIRQAVAVKRAVQHTRKIKMAGQVVWAAGFDVAPEFWRPQ